MTFNLAPAIQEVDRIVDQIAETLEWQKLAERENGSRRLPSFWARDRHRHEILDLYGRFLELSMRIQALLEASTGSRNREEICGWKVHLSKLNDRVQNLGIMENYIKP